MSDLPPIFVINRSVDTDRHAQIEADFKSIQITPQFIEAIDGHGDLRSLLPFIHMLGDHFWGKPEIKPGAFACFLSHQLAWKKVIDENLKCAMIIEDDTKPIDDFQNQWPKLEHQISQTDLIFLNNRMSDWVDHDFEDVSTAIWKRLALDNLETKFRAPGGDGYLLTQNGARKLLDTSLATKVFCGVDWFMLSTAWDSSKAKHKDVKNIGELKQIWREIGSRPAAINATALKNPLFHLRKGEKSKINHSDIIPIERFRKLILG